MGPLDDVRKLWEDYKKPVWHEYLKEDFYRLIRNPDLSSISPLDIEELQKVAKRAKKDHIESIIAGSYFMAIGLWMIIDNEPYTTSTGAIVSSVSLAHIIRRAMLYFEARDYTYNALQYWFNKFETPKRIM